MIKLLRLLAESWRGGVPLLYSNLELFLPIWAMGKSDHFPDKGPYCRSHSELAPADLHIQQLDGNVTPKASFTDSRSVRNISRLSRRKYIPAVFDSTSSSSLTQTPQISSLSSKRADSRAPSRRDKTEQNAAKVATNCLDALADFFDLMSYLDATMPQAAAPDAFVWTGAEVKDGMLDEKSEEGESRTWSQESLLDMQAAVEGLGCHRCLWRASEAWTEAQKYRQELGGASWGRLVERLTFPASSKRQSLSFSFQPLCAPRWVCSPSTEYQFTLITVWHFSLLNNWYEFCAVIFQLSNKLYSVIWMCICKSRKQKCVILVPVSTSVSQRRYELSRTVLCSKSFSLLGNRRAVGVDYMSFLRCICRFQREQRQKEEPARWDRHNTCLNQCPLQDCHFK